MNKSNYVKGQKYHWKDDRKITVEVMKVWGDGCIDIVHSNVKHLMEHVQLEDGWKLMILEKKSVKLGELV